MRHLWRFWGNHRVGEGRPQWTRWLVSWWLPFAGPSAQLLPPPTTSLLAARRPWYQLLNHLWPNPRQLLNTAFLARVLPLQKTVSLNQISPINSEIHLNKGLAEMPLQQHTLLKSPTHPKQKGFFSAGQNTLPACTAGSPIPTRKEAAFGLMFKQVLPLRSPLEKNADLPGIFKICH